MEAVPPQLIPIAVAVLGVWAVSQWLSSGGRDETRLIKALESQGQFQHFVQSLVPRNKPPGTVVKFITKAVRDVLGGQAYIELQGSARKRTNVVQFSDHDYHIKMPGGWFRSAEPVTSVQMRDIERRVNMRAQDDGLHVEAMMARTALKVRYCDEDVCGSIDLVPINGNYFDRGVVVEPADSDFHNNIPRQNAARASKFVSRCWNWRIKSYDLERAVVRLDNKRAIFNDRHGLKLFKAAMHKYGPHWPRDLPQDLVSALNR